jgi:hypothetical protein
LAPFLFNVFIDDLARSLDTPGRILGGHLFADDAAANGQTAEELQAQLSKIHLWTQQNGMKVNIGKCGHQSPGHRFFLGDEEVPYTAEYKYLGFLTTRKGIGWKQHVDFTVEKAKALFNYCQRIGDAWHPIVRLTILKSFIRPKLEYGFPLLAAYQRNLDTVQVYGPDFRENDTQRRRRLKEDLFVPARNLQDQVLKWIIPCAGTATHAAAVLGIPDIRDRAEGLGCHFVTHMRQMPEDHPARDLVRHYLQQVAYPQEALLPSAYVPTVEEDLAHPKANQLFKLFERRQRQNLERNNHREAVGIESMVKKWYIERLEKVAITAKYICRTSRANGTGADQCLKWTDHQARNWALRWRVGAFSSPRVTCPRNHLFTRRCINGCELQFPNLDEPDLTYRRPEDPPEHYSVLDMLLNAGRMEDFKTSIQELLGNLENVPRTWTRT